jgi:hypothetical protein
MACDYGRVNYIDSDEISWPIYVSVSVDWANIEAHRFIAYLLLAHVLRQPPSDASISELVACYGDRFEPGQEWSITEDEVRGLAWTELAPSCLAWESPDKALVRAARSPSRTITKPARPNRTRLTFDETQSPPFQLAK